MEKPLVLNTTTGRQKAGEWPAADGGAQVLVQDLSVVGTSNTASAFDVATLNLSGGSIAAGDMFSIELAADVLNDSGGAVSLTVTLFFGSTALITTSSDNFAVHGSRRQDVRFSALMLCPSTSAQTVEALWTAIPASGGQMTTPRFLYGHTELGSETTTATKALKVVAQFSAASPSLTLRRTRWQVIKYPAVT